MAVDGLPLRVLGDKLPPSPRGGWKGPLKPPGGGAPSGVRERTTQLFEAPPRRGPRSCVPPSQLLAVVFDTFNDIEKRKFKSLLLHKRTAIQHAYRLLIGQRVRRSGCGAGEGRVPGLSLALSSA